MFKIPRRKIAQALNVYYQHYGRNVWEVRFYKNYEHNGPVHGKLHHSRSDILFLQTVREVSNDKQRYNSLMGS